MIKKNNQLIYPELSYEVVGILFSVHRELGNRYPEKVYQRAIEKALEKRGLSFEREVYMPISYDGESVGKQFFDFVINGKILLEIKAVPRLRITDFRQILGYLKHANLRLGILANFRTDSLSFRRIINLK